METNKIIKYFLIISLLLIVGGFAVYFYTLTTQEGIDDFEDFKNTYIFGEPTIGGLDGGISEAPTPIGVPIGGVELSKLRQITPSPIAGFYVIQDEGKVRIRYTERATGNIYEANTISATRERLSNTTIPKIYESIWVDEKSSIIRYLDERDNIKSFYSEIADGEIEGVFLSDNIKDLITTGTKILYTLTNGGGSQIILSNPDGSGKEQVFGSSVTEWLIQRPRKGIITLTTKSSAGVPGYMYSLNVNSADATKIIDGVVGLTASMNGEGSYVIVSRSNRNSFSLNLYDVKNKSMKALSLTTFPEKCVWSGDHVNIYCGVPTSILGGSYPDVWYQGVESFNDDIYKINVEKNTAELLISPENFSGAKVDLIKPQLNEEETHLFFVDKKDSSLWSLEL